MNTDVLTGEDFTLTDEQENNILTIFLDEEPTAAGHCYNKKQMIEYVKRNTDRTRLKFPNGEGGMILRKGFLKIMENENTNNYKIIKNKKNVNESDLEIVKKKEFNQRLQAIRDKKRKTGSDILIIYSNIKEEEKAKKRSRKSKLIY